jgi:hypothetical protein
MADESNASTASSAQSPSESNNEPILRQTSSGSSTGGVNPRTSSFKDSDKYERTKSGTFIRRDSEIRGSGMPDFRQAIKDRLAKTRDQLPQGLMREVLETYKPHILGRRRQLIEDCVRDLRLNNDHIHIVEQEMRRSIEVIRNASNINIKKLRFYEHFAALLLIFLNFNSGWTC